MYNKNEVACALEREKIMAIIRGVQKNDVPNLLNALYEGGVRAVEFPFGENEDETAETIFEAVKSFGDKMYIGAGTVINTKRFELSLSSGAGYVITPVCDLGLAEACKATKLCSIIGAFTPTEVKEADNAGADFVKLFPADAFGPSYIKAILTPLKGIKIAAFGGINLSNADDYFNAGATLLGVGADLVDKRAIACRAFDKISAKAAEYVRIANCNK